MLTFTHCTPIMLYCQISCLSCWYCIKFVFKNILFYKVSWVAKVVEISRPYVKNGVNRWHTFLTGCHYIFSHFFHGCSLLLWRFLTPHCNFYFFSFALCLFVSLNKPFIRHTLLKFLNHRSIINLYLISLTVFEIVMSSGWRVKK